ncbi:MULTISPECIES: MCE family protein [unclassified Mycobacterium]|uniref:MCE family protein n=1 Tax=unclassified Mycobacterium TaxID=2642494 RepID=UPI0029C97392|nr:MULTISPECIES: MCE family protein [unclassified Mycobacterium]
MSRSALRRAVATTLAGLLAASAFVAASVSDRMDRVHVTAYFSSANGLYPGDQVRILGVPVGEITSITPESDGSKVTFWFDRRFKVPANAEAAVLSPALVSARVIQLSPPYTGGDTMTENAVIPNQRTAVPVEYDELRTQLAKLSESLQPTGPGGLSAAGSMINTTANNLRGQGANIRGALTELSQALSALGDHSDDISGTVKDLSVLVSALRSSSDVLQQLNGNLASVTGLLAQNPNAVGAMLRDLDVAVRDVDGFVADNRAALGTTFDRLSSLSTMLHERLPELKQTLHVTPNTLSNFVNAYRPATASVAGTFALTNFANPLQFICSGIQAASRLNYEQSAKLCAQYMAPIIKNREYNFPPLGTTIGLLQIPTVGAMARPNEITYSEDWMRPDYRPTSTPGPNTEALAPPGAAEALPGAAASLADEPVTPNPQDGLRGLMTPPGAGS